MCVCARMCMSVPVCVSVCLAGLHTHTTHGYICTQQQQVLSRVTSKIITPTKSRGRRKRKHLACSTSHPVWEWTCWGYKAVLSTISTQTNNRRGSLHHYFNTQARRTARLPHTHTYLSIYNVSLILSPYNMCLFFV